jgi:hypothetical protein
MAVNKLKRNSTEISLVAGTDGFHIQRGGYIPATVERNRDGTYPPEVNEALSCFVTGDDTDDMASKVRAVRIILRQSSDAQREPVDDNLVWWHRQLDNETREYRAMVKHGKVEQRSSVYGPPASPGSFLQDVGVGIVRTPLWEYVTAGTVTSSDLESAGDIWDYSSGSLYTIHGDAPARIRSMNLTSPYTGQGPLTEWWLGFRTDRLGDRSKFAPVWDCADGTGVTDTSASGGVMVCTFADTSMQERFTLALNQVTNITAGDEDEHRGRFLVLLRAATTSTREARLYLKSGFADSGVWKNHDYVKVADTNYLFYPVGEIQIPPTGRHETHSESYWKDEQYFSLAIEAESITGSGNLNMDRFVVVPLSEGSCHIKDGYAYYSAGTTYRTWVLCTPEGDFICKLDQQAVGHSPHIAPDPTLGFYPPVGDGSLVYAAQRSTVQNTGDYGRVQFSYYLRYEEMMGDGINA